MEQNILQGLSPSWPMVGLLAAFFIYLVKLGFNVNTLLESLTEHKQELREHKDHVDERFDDSHKEMATWINNHHESKVKPIEADVTRLEKEQARLHVTIADEYKVLRLQNDAMVKELGEVRIFMATMNERWKHLMKERE